MNDLNNNASYPTNTSRLMPAGPELEPKYAETMRLSFSAIICSIGIVGNILVIIITGGNRANKTAVHKYILNLAIADIGVLAICYPLTLVKAADPLHWPLGRVVCKVLYPFTDIFFSASIGSIVAVAIDRHRAIVRGMTAYRSLSIAKWVILSIWLAGFASAVVPVYFVMQFIENKQNGTVDCTPRWPNNLTFALYVFSLSIFWYILPLILILWVYRQIASKIRASKLLHRKINNMCGSYRNEKKKKKYDTVNTKAMKILVPVVIMFAVTMFPFHVFRLVSVFVDIRRVKYIWVVYNICTILLLTNSAANPIIYSLVSEEFRQRFKEILYFNCKHFAKNRREDVVIILFRIAFPYHQPCHPGQNVKRMCNLTLSFFKSVIL
ncbi:hypothetical protein OS493_002973 [Desmophyllum pertusum]|uniref:G-protein coupled receptors family 1 profile domain-containing protein n=1 Tax=Desmophyllum pertusum TaxID=174260 RepID=A0A9W9YGP7_9CNID|nr:hypothetical protein OS493_002973 [Desmophyllum pertusum]